MSVSLIPDSQGLPLSIDSLFYREADTAYHVQEHSQPLHQWYMCVHGSIAIRLEAGTSILGPGQSILYRPGTLREPRCRGRAPGYLVAIFHNRELDLDPLCDQVLDLPLALRPELNALIAELVHPADQDSPYLRQALLVRLLIGQRRAHRPSVSVLNAAAANGTVILAEEFMRSHLDQPLTRTSIAKAAHCSVPHLTRIFRTAADTTVFARLTTLRLEKARELLRESDQPIGNIALATGFPSFSHFARTFKAATGLAPSAYRRTGGAAWR
jgi:AraC-like DNA-binding protein